MAVESLEGRALLSHFGHVPAHPAELGAHTAAPLVYRGPDIGPIKNVVGHGFAVKLSRFYPFFTGQKRVDLNTVGALGMVSPDGRSLLLGGITVDPLPKSVSDPAKSDFYFFGINRGGATNPGPFPGRPNIVFDAIVGVSITPDGVSGFVKDLNSSAPATPLPAGSLRVRFDTIHVTVPLSLLPSTGPGGASRYQVNFWSQDAPIPSPFTSVASFVPEFRGFQVATPSRVPPNF